MISKKICLLGSVCVGKTSLARRFMYSCFSDKYHSTIGVKLHKKSITIDNKDLNLIVWDIQGEDRYDKVMVSFLKGLSGYILVVDVTQPHSATVACELRDRVKDNFGDVPYTLAYSKCDLQEHSETFRQASALEIAASDVIRTSSLTGDGVNDAFHHLASIVMPGNKSA